MKFNQTTYNLSLAVLVIFAIYTLLYSGLTGVLLCSSVALITASFVDTFEIVVAISIIFGLFYIYFLRKILQRFEPFQNKDDATKIVSRVKNMSAKYHQEPQGVYNPAIEGFEDIQPKIHKDGESAQSSSAPNVLKEQVKLPIDDSKSEEEKKGTDEMASATGKLFKAGQLPSENKDGAHLDSGSTLLKAMESFKPEQVSAMTTDTKKLIETQKNLMEMLKGMQPILQDGKQLLDTFSGMFGGNGGMFKL
jgi:hypothetical protein